MAYYDVLIAAWNSVTQPPVGVTGTALTGGMTTVQKLAAVNGWKIATPQKTIVSTYQIYNIIVRSEFTALTAANQQSVRDIIGMGIIDGSPGTQIRAQLIAIFPSGTATFANLAALVAPFDGATSDWCSANDYPSHGQQGPGNLSLPDCTKAGLV